MDSCPVTPAPATQQRYTLHESFYNVLAEVGAKQGQPYEWKDIIRLFIIYLARRKPSLLDPENKSRVICGDDPLGRVFGVSCFTKEETKLLVRQHVSLWEEDCAYASQPLASLPPSSGPAPPPPNVEQPVKRGPAEVAPDDPDSKRSRPETAAAATATAGEPGPSCAPVAPAGPAPAPATADRWPNSIGETELPPKLAGVTPRPPVRCRAEQLVWWVQAEQRSGRGVAG